MAMSIAITKIDATMFAGIFMTFAVVTSLFFIVSGILKEKKEKIIKNLIKLTNGCKRYSHTKININVYNLECEKSKDGRFLIKDPLFGDIILVDRLEASAEPPVISEDYVLAEGGKDYSEEIVAHLPKNIIKKFSDK